MKPAGVVLIAVLYWISACFMALVALGLLLGMSLIGMLSPDPRITAVLAGFGGIAAVFLLVLAALVAFVGWSLFSLKEWARVVTIVLAVLGILGSAGGLAFLHFTGISPALGVVRLALNIVIIWYLLQPRVKMIFR